MSAPRLVGSFRDWLNARALKRMVARQHFPETIERHYWDRKEFGTDAAALEAVGYAPLSTSVNDAYVGSGTLPAASNGVGGHLDRTVRRRVAPIHVLYRRPETAAQS
ncbi:MAG TPA: hypothetical protein VND88_14560 [Candidatus Acidoferrales bacterium]|nr:hypothetical protein [Candidatus Acidoferrales bacterium]